MKKLLLLLPAIILFGFTSDEPAHYFYYQPVVIDIEDLRNSFSFQEPQPLKKPSKIYVKGNYLFVSEKYEGIHVFDNTNPENPVNVGFIKVLGCVDMAVKGTTLYADNAIDLVAVDIGNPEAPVLKSRVMDVFPEITPPDGYIPSIYQKDNRPDGTVIIAWKPKN